MDDELSGAVHTWADWWAEVATITESLPPKSRLPARSVVDKLFARFIDLRRAEATDPLGAPLMDHVLATDPGFNRRYARDIATSAVIAARQSILSYLQHQGPTPLLGFPRPKAPDSDMIAVRDGKIVAAGGVTSGKHHIRALGDLLAPGRPFVFARCPSCGRIFARKGRRLRCSIGCTQKVNDAKRPPEQRREQNREAARRYRERQRTVTARKARRGTGKEAQ